MGGKKNKKGIKAHGTAHNRTVYASPPNGGSGYEKPQSAYGLCAVFLRHILTALEMLRISLFGRAKTSYTANRYAPLPRKYINTVLFFGVAFVC
jgi:hypothetical protein